MKDFKVRGNDAEQRFRRSFGNKLWRLCNLYKIKTKDAKVINFRPNFVQRRILRDIRKDCDSRWNPVRPIRHQVVKYRQGGVSTFWLLWWLDEACFHSNFDAGIMAHDLEALGKLFRMIRFAHASMPDEYRPELGSDSKRELTFPGISSKISVALEHRSAALQALHISEHCLSKDERIIASIAAVPPMTGHISSESTGNGVGNHGYQTYQDAKAGRNRWTDLFVPWFLQREYRIPRGGRNGPLKLSPEEERLVAIAQKEWNFTIDEDQILFRRDKKRDLKKLFPQEFPETDKDAFLASGSPFFDNFKISALLEEVMAQDELPEEEYNYKVFIKPIKKHRYAAGADPADEGADNAVLKIMDIDTKEEVFVWKGRVSASKFADICDRWGRCFNNAFMGVEDNNMGIAVLLKLDEIHKYKNLYVRERPKNRTRIVRSGQITMGGEGKSKGKLGWHTDMKSKPQMLSQFKSAIEGDFDDDAEHFEPDFKVKDEWLLQEALVFSDLDGKLEAQSGAHDDCVIASAICWQMVLIASRNPKRTGEETGSKKIRFGNKRPTA